MFRRILVPLDGSALAEAALGMATLLADPAGAEIRLLTVRPADDPDRAEAVAHLERARSDLAARWPGPVSTHVLAGTAVAGIEAETVTWDADLVAMTTHGRGGLARAWLGSVADRFIRAADRPVLVLRPPTEDGPPPSPPVVDKIVVPVDGSEIAEAAIPLGSDLARDLGLPLLLVRSVMPTGPVGFNNLPELAAMSREIDEDARERASEYLRELVVGMRPSGVHPSASLLTDVDPAAAILSQSSGGLVVMTTHGRSGLDRIVIGSVADKVVRASASPVLVIPARARTRATSGP